MKKTFIVILFLPIAAICQPAYYDVQPGIGNGYRFYQDDTYKISMGIGLEYGYGPVTDYSMRAGMDATQGRGWVWGIGGQTPIAGLSNQGVFKISGSSYTGPYMGSAAVVGRIASSGPTSEISLTNRTVSSWVEIPTQGERWVMYSDGTPTDGTLRFWSGADKVTLTKQGNLGIGVGSPAGKLHVKSLGSSNTTYSSYTSADVGLVLQNGNSTNSNFNILTFADASGWGVADVGAITNHSNHTSKLFFSTRPASAGPMQRMTIDENGNVGIGTTSPNQMLTVNGAIYGKQVKVDLSVPGPDYVFEKSYSLPSLDLVKSYIDENKHLPEVPSAKEMEAKGIDVGEMNMLLLKKIEELTLYVIDLKKENEKQQTEIEKLKNN